MRVSEPEVTPTGKSSDADEDRGRALAKCLHHLDVEWRIIRETLKPGSAPALLFHSDEERERVDG